MPKTQLKIPKFQSLDAFQQWFESPEVVQFCEHHPDKIHLLQQHRLVNPWWKQLKGKIETIIESEKKEMEKVQTAGRVFGKYLLEKKLGQGGMGVVYLARDPVLNRRVALKVMLLKGKEAMERFTREARASAKLKHPHIIQLYEVGTVDKYHYFTMEYIEGTSLEQVIKDKKTLPKRVVEIILQITLALHYAHSQGIIHRDIKPSNILIDLQGKAYLMDFGLAKETSGLEHSLTLSGTIMGTADYMSPEQAMGLKKQIDHRSDIFSLGATLYHALTGHPPFSGKELYQILDSVVNKEPIAPTRLVRTLSRDMETICLKCLEKDKTSRYQSAEILAADLVSYLEGEAISAKPHGLLTKLWRKVRKNKTLSFSLASAAVILLIVIIGLLVSSAKTKDKLENYRKEALSYLKENKFDEARVVCEKIREITRSDQEINTLYKKCLTEIEKKKEETSQKDKQYKLRAEAKTVLDRAERTPSPDGKIKIAEEALKIDPTYADAYQVMGMGWKEKHDYDRAVECFSKAIELSPTSAYAYYERGLITAYIWNRPEEAVHDFENVLKYDPGSHIGWFAKGTIEDNQKKYDEAIGSYSKAIEIYPEYAMAYNNRGVVYYETVDKVSILILSPLTINTVPIPL